jgi:hypothetical protein
MFTKPDSQIRVLRSCLKKAQLYHIRLTASYDVGLPDSDARKRQARKGKRIRVTVVAQLAKVALISR